VQELSQLSAPSTFVPASMGEVKVALAQIRGVFFPNAPVFADRLSVGYGCAVARLAARMEHRAECALVHYASRLARLAYGQVQETAHLGISGFVSRIVTFKGRPASVQRPEGPNSGVRLDSYATAWLSSDRRPCLLLREAKRTCRVAVVAPISLVPAGVFGTPRWQ